MVISRFIQELPVEPSSSSPPLTEQSALLTEQSVLPLTVSSPTALQVGRSELSTAKYSSMARTVPATVEVLLDNLAIHTMNKINC